MKIIRRFSFIISFILSIFCVWVFSLSKSISINPNSGMVFLYLVLFTCIFKHVIMNMNKRQVLISCIFGLIFGIIMSIGNHYFINGNQVFLKSKIFYLDIMALTVLFSSLIHLLLEYLPKVKENIEKLKLPKRLENVIKQANRKTFLFTFIVITLLWILPFLAVYPGYFCYDADTQLIQYQYGKWSAWQPVVHTLLMGGLVVNLGNDILGSYSIGLTLYCIMQALLIISTFSYLVVFLAKRKVPTVVLEIGILLFAVNPIIQILSFSTIKVTFFTCFFAFLLMFLIEMIEDPERYFLKKRNLIKFIVVAIFMSLFRKQGIYIIIVLFLILGVYLHKYWKKLLVIFATVIVPVFAFFGPISNCLHITKSPASEMLSIPVQQIAAVIKNNKDSITEEEWTTIKNYFEEESLDHYYIPQISDPVKELFRNEELEKDKMSFIKLWIQLGLKNKQVYINAFIDMNIGYFYPSVEAVSDWAIISPYKNKLDIELNSLCEPYYEYLQYATNEFFEGKPFVSFFVCEAMPLWVILLILAILWKEKKYPFMIPILALLLYFGTCILAPVCCIRYIYPLLALLPMVVALPFVQKKGG